MSNRHVNRAIMMLVLLIIPATLLVGCTGNRFDRLHSPLCEGAEEMCK
jgi:hypothetical protein